MQFQWPRLTPAIKHLMLVNAAVFVANMLLIGRLSAPGSNGGGFWFAFSWPGLFDLFGLGVLRVVTYQFTHDWTSMGHVVMNMLVLYFFGTSAEARLGYRGTWKLYLVGGAVGALLHLALAFVQGQQDVPLVGASGACYAFLIYCALRDPYSIVYVLLFPVPLWIVAAALCTFAVYDTYIEIVTGYSGRVSHGAHLGGALLGFLAFKRSWFIDWGDHANLERPGLLRGFWLGLQKKRAEARQRDAHSKQLQMDEILDKVKREGLGALSAAERRFLEQMSKQARKGE